MPTAIMYTCFSLSAVGLASGRTTVNFAGAGVDRMAVHIAGTRTGWRQEGQRVWVPALRLAMESVCWQPGHFHWMAMTRPPE